MFHSQRNRSLDYEPETRAVASLLDCSNTLRVKNSSKTLKREHESITPWLHLNRKPMGETRSNCTIIRPTRNFGKTYNRYKLRQQSQREQENRTVLSTPKNRLILDEIENYNYLSSNVINLTRELELIHHKRKTNYVNNYIRQQLYLRLKTS